MLSLLNHKYFVSNPLKLSLPLAICLLYSTSEKAIAACALAGTTYTCDSTAPNPVTSTVGASGNNGYSVIFQDGARIATTGSDNGITLGNSANITFQNQVTTPAIINLSTVNGIGISAINSGTNIYVGQAVGDKATISAGNNSAISLTGSATNASTINVYGTVTNNSSSGSGGYGTGGNTIEFNTNTTLNVYNGGIVRATGSQSSAEAVNPQGSTGTNQINVLAGGLIETTQNSVAIWNQNGAKLIIDNSGIIASKNKTDPNNTNTVIGGKTSGGVDFYNRQGAST